MSGVLAEHTREAGALDAAAAAQERYARTTLANHGDLDLLILGHTHRPVLCPVAHRRWYLNPGAWIDGLRFAVITSNGPELCVFDSKL